MDWSGRAIAALVGATASGKSSVAEAVARRRTGLELVSMDSMTVYRGMDIGTAKPSPGVRAEVPHHLLDLADPSEEFTVSRFQQEARTVLDDLARRHRDALLVGGTGLYVRAVIDDLRLPGRWPETAARLERQADRSGGLADLYARLVALDPVGAARIVPSNRRRIVRALEVTEGSGRPFSSFGPGLEVYPTVPFPIVGLTCDPAELDRRIRQRFEQWVERGLVDEVRALAGRPEGLSWTARQALGYRELLAHVEAGVPLQECVEEAVRRTRRFARRQRAWFRRDPRIQWVAAGEDPVQVVMDALDAAGASAPE